VVCTSGAVVGPSPALASPLPPPASAPGGAPSPVTAAPVPPPASPPLPASPPPSLLAIVTDPEPARLTSFVVREMPAPPASRTVPPAGFSLRFPC
jgi:hypothetical protein